MPKGRKPKGEYSGKSLVFSTRISPELRGALEKAAKLSGRSLSQEVEHRLRRSFAEDETIVDLFGSRQTYRVMRMMADAIQICQRPGEAVGHPDMTFDWMANAAAFHMARQAIVSVLDMIAPDGTPGTEDQVKAAEVLGEAVAGMLWSKVRAADSAIPLAKKTRAAAYKADLMDILPRTADEAHNERLKKKAVSALKVIKKATPRRMGAKSK
jgi:hypothetical protein